jgi:hypothetical protein
MPFYHNINKKTTKIEKREKEINNEVGELVHLWVLWWRSKNDNNSNNIWHITLIDNGYQTRETSKTQHLNRSSKYYPHLACDPSQSIEAKPQHKTTNIHQNKRIKVNPSSTTSISKDK